MTHQYTITGMTCSGCENSIKTSLFKLPDVTNVEILREKSEAVITMAKHISISDLQNAIGAESKYRISAVQHNETVEQTKSWLETYKPLLLVFAFISLVSILTSLSADGLNINSAMNTFMAGFFLVFSFFKFLDLKKFAESYAMYDMLAKQANIYGYVYPFIELALGIFYLLHFNPFITNITTITVMGFSSIGVIKSVFKKQKIQCACLGSVFNLPMSTVTIIEDLLMVLMAAVMLYLH